MFDASDGVGSTIDKEWSFPTIPETTQSTNNIAAFKVTSKMSMVEKYQRRLNRDVQPLSAISDQIHRVSCDMQSSGAIRLSKETRSVETHRSVSANIRRRILSPVVKEMLSLCSLNSAPLMRPSTVTTPILNLSTCSLLSPSSDHISTHVASAICTSKLAHKYTFL